MVSAMVTAWRQDDDADVVVDLPKLYILDTGASFHLMALHDVVDPEDRVHQSMNPKEVASANGKMIP